METINIDGIGEVKFRTFPAGRARGITVDLPDGPIRSGLMTVRGDYLAVHSGQIFVEAKDALTVIEDFARAILAELEMWRESRAILANG